MKRIFTFLIVIALSVPAFSQKVDPMVKDGKPNLPALKSKKITNKIIEYAGGEGTGIYVPAPRAVRENPGQARLTANNLFNVQYIGFPDSVRTAFQYALDIWANYISSSVQIKVEATWEPLDPGVLGGAYPGTAYTYIFYSRNFDAWHPVALAEKIIGENLNGTDPDIVISFNSDANWYVGTDGNPNSAKGEYDLVTVVLHEVGHGLGFLDFTDVESGIGEYLFGSDPALPWIYTTLLENGSGENIVENYNNGTTALGTQFTSDDLFFNERISYFNYDNNMSPVPVYAPSTYQPGSSIAHLDISIKLNEGGLMRPGITFGDAVHDPGIALYMLNDMGWALTFINHDGTPNTEDINNPITINAEVTSDTDVDSSSFILVYSTELNSPFTDQSLIDTVQFSLITKGSFDTQVPAFGEPTLYSYYMVIKDEYGRTFVNPPGAPGTSTDPRFYQVGASPDDEPPILVHTPIFFVEQGTSSVPILAQSADFLPDITVVVDYFIDGAPQTPIQLTLEPGTSTVFTGDFNLSASLPVGTEISYKVTATDAAASMNQTSSPETGYHVFSVIDPIVPVMEYSNNFDQPTIDFIGDLFVGTTSAGFSSPALHSAHPYAEGPAGGFTNYVSELIVPITINEEVPYIIFDEVVLVEPGNDGSVFGGGGFWDYVIVEGSTDGGQTWRRFIDGYDATDNPGWQGRYASNVNGFDSQATGDEELYTRRKINMLENGSFDAGQTVKIRWRLYSDELAVGWGWAIDNLSIQSLIAGIDDLIVEESFNLYPNPSNGNFTLKAQLKEPISRATLRVTSLMGQSVLVRSIESTDSQLDEQIDLSNSPDGLYIVSLETPKGKITRKVMKMR